MMASGSGPLWVAATAGSLAVHALVGYTLFAMPMPEVRPEAVTEIHFATPDDGLATSPPASATTEAVNPRHGLARASVPVASTVLPGGNSDELAPSSTDQAALAPSTADSVSAIGPQAVPPSAAETAPANPADPVSTLAALTPPASAVQTRESSAPLAPMERPPEAVEGLRGGMEVAPNAIDAAVAASANERAAAVTAPSPLQSPAAFDAEQLAALDLDVAPPVDAAPEEIAPADDRSVPLPARETIALPPSVSDPLVAPGVQAESLALVQPTGPALEPASAADIAPIPVRPDSAPPAAASSAPPASPQQPLATVAPAQVAANQAQPRRESEASPPLVPAVTAPAIGQAPRAAGPVRPSSGQSVAGASRAEPLQPARRALADAADAAPVDIARVAPIAPGDAMPRIAAGVAEPSPALQIPPAQQQTALLPIPRIDADERPDPDAEGLITSFLRGRRSDDCLLALPSQGAGVEAFSVSREGVELLAADFERQAKSALETTVRRVAAAQCSALGFGRALPQYPNYLLQVNVINPEIRSGEILKGIVSGVVKDTLYLVAVDDEGNAKLVESGMGLTTDTYRFSEAVHLTTDPVESVQLLVAVASDGPLTSMPDRAGQPADLFFSRLTLEIISGDRSISYGMSSFTIR